VARRIDRRRNAEEDPGEVSAVEPLPRALLPDGRLSREEYAARGELRRKWFSQQGIERDWNARGRAEAEGFRAAGIVRPDPRATLISTTASH
jgi:hypothetical protein